MAANKKRLFFALWPDATTRAALAARTCHAVAAAGGRGVPEMNLHLTLAFLHNVGIERLGCIFDAAGRAGDGPFTLTLSRIGAWSRSRILWLAPPQGAAPEAAGLATRLWSELAVCGFEPERRAFRPHVTLARKIRAPDTRAQIEPVVWPVEAFALMESVPAGPRPRYEVVRTFPLE